MCFSENGKYYIAYCDIISEISVMSAITFCEAALNTSGKHIFFTRIFMHKHAGHSYLKLLFYQGG